VQHRRVEAPIESGIELLSDRRYILTLELPDCGSLGPWEKQRVLEVTAAAAAQILAQLGRA